MNRQDAKDREEGQGARRQEHRGVAWRVLGVLAVESSADREVGRGVVAIGRVSGRKTCQSNAKCNSPGEAAPGLEVGPVERRGGHARFDWRPAPHPER